MVSGGGADVMCTPRKWVDIWGRRIDESWNQAVECARGWLMSRPGMTEVGSFLIRDWSTIDGT